MITLCIWCVLTIAITLYATLFTLCLSIVYHITESSIIFIAIKRLSFSALVLSQTLTFSSRTHEAWRISMTFDNDDHLLFICFIFDAFNCIYSILKNLTASFHFHLRISFHIESWINRFESSNLSIHVFSSLIVDCAQMLILNVKISKLLSQTAIAI